MHRTQIYLEAEEVRLLDRESRRTGASRSELIRRAIRERYGTPREDDAAAKLDALRRSAGAWKGRDFSGTEYVDRMRGDLNERLRRLGLD